jgi:hypothetical protein
MMTFMGRRESLATGIIFSRTMLIFLADVPISGTKKSLLDIRMYLESLPQEFVPKYWVLVQRKEHGEMLNILKQTNGRIYQVNE